jgi:enoyl-CoA hydratase/carnithine racemase
MNHPTPRMSPTSFAPMSEGISTLTLNRGAAVQCPVAGDDRALQAQLDAIAADPALRVVVIAGAGKAFCAGHDLKEMRANHHKAFMQDLFRVAAR